MRAPTKASNSDQRQRISEELRQLKQMSKSLRTKAMRTMLERHAAQRLDAQPRKPPLEKPLVLPAKPASVAA
jgi:hypothetical protein